MPLARLDALGICLYGGTILPGLCEGKEEPLDAQSVMEVCEEALDVISSVLFY